MKLINGEALEEMDKLIKQWLQVDAIITDPPYWTIKDALWTNWKADWDVKIDSKELLTRCNKLLRMNWRLILFSQEPYTSELITSTDWIIPFSYRLIWKKDHFANVLNSKRAPVNYFEDICIFSKKYDTELKHPLRKYAKLIVDFVWVKEKKLFEQMGHQGAFHFWRYDTLQFTLCTEKTYKELIKIYWIDKMEWFKEYKELKDINKKFIRIFNLPKWKKHKSNILEYKKDYTWFHPTQKPVALMEDLIFTYTKEWDTILDFTAGSFSTCIAADNTNRKWIWIEKDKEYCKIWKNRIIQNRKDNKLDLLDFTSNI